MEKLEIFISSKMQELSIERLELYEYIPSLGNEVMQFHAWVFEKNAPASGEAIRDIYLEKLRQCSLYIGIFWNEYGEWTIDEFYRAAELGIEQHVYVKNISAELRDPKLQLFIDQHTGVTSGATFKWFQTLDELKEAVKESISFWIKHKVIRQNFSVNPRIINSLDDFSLSELPRLLIGRDELIESVSNYLRTRQNVLLQGYPGIGKTTLAASITAKLVDEFKKSALWIRLGNSDIQTVLEALNATLSAFTVIDQNEVSLAKRITNSIKLSNISLITLDDCWNLNTLKRLIEVLPRNIPVLITSRKRFGLVDQLISVPELTLHASIELLNYHRGSSEIVSELNDICIKLGNLAFAVEIAGRTMKARGWSPQELLSNIEIPHEFAMPHSMDDSTSSSNVAALINTSLHSLDDITLKFFLAWGSFFAPTISPDLLSIFTTPLPEYSPDDLTEMKQIYLQQLGSLSPKAYEEAIHAFDRGMELSLAKETVIASNKTKSKLIDLLDNGLARFIPQTDEWLAHYRLHDLIYSFTNYYATREGKIRALKRCVFYATRYSEPTKANFIAIATELDNLIGAIQWSFENGFVNEGLSIISSLVRGTNGEGGYLDFRGYYSLSLSLLRQAVLVAENYDTQLGAEVFMTSLGIYYRRSGQPEQALTYFEKSLVLAKAKKRTLGYAAVLVNMGNSFSEIGNNEEAKKCFQRVLRSTHKSKHDQHFKVSALGGLGVCYYRQGDLKRAIKYFEQAIDLAKDTKQFREVGRNMLNISEVYIELYDHNKALGYLQSSLEIASDLGDIPLNAHILAGFGKAFMYAKRLPEALKFFSQAREICYQLGIVKLASQIDASIELIENFSRTDEKK